MNKKMIIIIIIILAVTVGITAYLNQGSIAEKDNAQKNALVTIKEDGVEVKTVNMSVVKEVDGYTVALTAKEVKVDDNVYLVYQSDGKPLKGKKEGGTGPYRLVIKNDQFGQRWCKFVTEVNVK